MWTMSLSFGSLHSTKTYQKQVNKILMNDLKEIKLGDVMENEGEYEATLGKDI